jgi:hypothetical protein
MTTSNIFSKYFGALTNSKYGYSFECDDSQFLDKLTAFMQKEGWESQGDGFFPDDGSITGTPCYYIQKAEECILIDLKNKEVSFGIF